MQATGDTLSMRSSKINVRCCFVTSAISFLQREDLNPEILTLYGTSLLSSKVLVEKGRAEDVVRSLLSKLISARQEWAIRWVATAIKMRPDLLSEQEDDSTLEDFRQRVLALGQVADLDDSTRIALSDLVNTLQAAGIDVKPAPEEPLGDDKPDA